MKLFAIDPVSIFSACMCDCQDLNAALFLAKDADVWESHNSAILKIKVDSCEPCRIRLDIPQKIRKHPIKPFRNFNGSLKIPVNRIFNLSCRFGAETDHRLSLPSILRFTSSHGIPGDGSLALRSNSSRKSGLSIDRPGYGPGSESSSSVAKRARSDSDKANDDLSTSSCVADMQVSLCGSPLPPHILLDESVQEKQSLGSSPIVMVVNGGQGSKGPERYWIGIIVHRDQANAIAEDGLLVAC